MFVYDRHVGLYIKKYQKCAEAGFSTLKMSTLLQLFQGEVNVKINVFKLHTSMECGASVYHTSVSDPILIG